MYSSRLYAGRRCSIDVGGSNLRIAFVLFFYRIGHGRLAASRRLALGTSYGKRKLDMADSTPQLLL